MVFTNLLLNYWMINFLFKTPVLSLSNYITNFMLTYIQLALHLFFTFLYKCSELIYHNFQILLSLMHMVTWSFGLSSLYNVIALLKNIIIYISSFSLVSPGSARAAIIRETKLMLTVDYFFLVQLWGLDPIVESCDKLISKPLKIVICKQ